MLPGPDDFRVANGFDCRNYGVLEGLPEARAFFGEFVGAPADQVIVGGNSSLTMMHDAVVRALLHGVPVGDSVGTPWLTQKAEGGIKFLCPSPGYDRHFAVCEHHGFELVTVDMRDDGPDMDQVEALVAGDAAIKGMWCVPKYSNPTGITYGDATVRRLAAMKTAAPDFRIFWDNAYAHHHLYLDGKAGEELLDVLAACAEAGHPDRPLLFGSTSKVSFAGSGVAAMAASPANVADALKHLGKQTIGPDKLNQLRHLAFFKDMAGVEAHMRRHAEILRPRFRAVVDAFEHELGGRNVATWTEPRGGYFVSLDTPDGCATEVVRLAGEAGVKLTGAGATFPYRKDPRDRNIRIAPTLPPLDHVRTAMEVVAVCVLLAAVRQRLRQA